MYQIILKAPTVLQFKRLNPEPSHSEKSAVKGNFKSIMSVNVCAVELISLQHVFFSCSHRGTLLVLVATVSMEATGDG